MVHTVDEATAASSEPDGSELRVGDWVVTGSRFGFDIFGPITRITAARIWHERWGHPGYLTDPVLYFGSEKGARDFFSEAVSIQRWLRTEQGKLEDQYRDRLAKAARRKMLPDGPKGQGKPLDAVPGMNNEQLAKEIGR